MLSKLSRSHRASPVECHLFNRYPYLFRDVQNIECADGWFPILDSLCNILQSLTDIDGYSQVHFTQVKEKANQLRVYTLESTRPEQKLLIDMARDISMRTCESCGKVKEPESQFCTECNLALLEEY